MTARAGRQRGAAMLIALLLVSSLMTIGVLAVALTLGETKSTGYAADAKASLYCAEAGLAKARSIVGANYADWNTVLAGGSVAWYPITGDLDVPADGIDDFTVTIKDNDDEPSTAPNDLTHDNDMRVFIVSTCTRYPETPRQVTELIYYTGGGNSYRDQSGQGAGNTGNAN